MSPLSSKGTSPDFVGAGRKRLMLLILAQVEMYAPGHAGPGTGLIQIFRYVYL